MPTQRPAFPTQRIDALTQLAAIYYWSCIAHGWGWDYTEDPGSRGGDPMRGYRQ